MDCDVKSKLRQSPKEKKPCKCTPSKLKRQSMKIPVFMDLRKVNSINFRIFFFRLTYNTYFLSEKQSFNGLSKVIAIQNK